MKRRTFVSASLLAAGFGTLLTARLPPRTTRYERTRDGRVIVRGAALAFDTCVSICALHVDPQSAQRAIDEALREIQHLDTRLTVQRAGSQVAELNRVHAVSRPDAHLVRLLRFGQQLASDSAGTFDPTVQPLWELHSDCARHGRVPERDELARACARVDWRAIQVRAGRVELPRGGGITLNGVLQGYAADVAFDVLAQRGVTNALIDAGEYGALGSNADGTAWRVGIQDPRDAHRLAGCVRMDGRFMATSGDYATHFTPDLRSHHIFDPHSGRSPARFSAVTVAAASGLIADGLTKPMMILPLDAATQLLSRYPGAGAAWWDKRGHIVAAQNLSVEPS